MGLTVLVCLQPLAHQFSDQDWRADILSHFPEPALAFTLILFAVALRRRRRLALALGLLACWQTTLVFWGVRANPVAPNPRSDARLKVLMANVLLDNDEHEALARLIRREQPDIVGLVEFSHAWQASLGDVRKEFASVTEFPAGASGLALWFRKPPEDVDGATRLRPNDQPFLHATFEFAGRMRHLFLLHLEQPFDPVARFPGNPELASLARRISETGGSQVAMGDLNTTDGSANLAAFLRTTGLRDSRHGFGRQGSFPTFSPYRIAIDHALVSDDLAVVDRRLGPAIGSDHYPLIFELAPASGPSNDSISPTSALQSSP